MGKIVMKKKSTSTDMTAMCDVAFLLLTFFILTATAKTPEVLPVDTPQSTVQTKLPADNLSMLTIGKVEGKTAVFFDLKGKDVRKKALEFMADKYNVAFTDKEAEEFSLMESFGVPIQNLKEILNMKAADRSKAGQPGIPKDSLDNQLKDWVLYSRKANIEVNDKELNFAIKGDAKEQYPAIKQVMDLLQDQKVNSFNLVTGLRGKNF
ncbi:biopolymer transporter ExbD [Flavobacterium sp. 5]|uniref:ExbD/TolR family protein n=1 Tax=Flavobacterium sp. 5 TaxID=2035199 RepID=UPI000C2CC0FC|nr:biopolymer transporter ExbD [Flavobacterium sp. 5]PKB17246.1 outer membrane transport energization protein ExbD [Flavobacterium sp. 5]